MQRIQNKKHDFERESMEEFLPPYFKTYYKVSYQDCYTNMKIEI